MKPVQLMNRRGEYQIHAEASATEILLYDMIGEDPWFGGGVSAKQFTEDLQAIKGDVNLRINSPGGDVFEGITMLNALRRHEGKVTVYVDGIAASAASVVAMGGDMIVMSRNSELMIHDAWGFTQGPAEDHQKQAELLSKMSDNLASAYADRAGGSVASWRQAMKDETWYSDAEAVTAGLADRVETNKTAKVKNSFNLSLYAYAGRTEAPDPYLPAEPPETTNQEGSPVTDTLNLRERLGLKAEASDEDVAAKLDAVLKNSEAPPEEPADEPDKDDEDDTEEKPAQAPGTVLVDEAQFNALKAAAEQGQQARAQQLAEHRNTLVQNAVSDGRISPARKADWLAALEKDPGSEATLAALPKGLVPVEAKGYTGNLTDMHEDADDAVYNSLYGKEA